MQRERQGSGKQELQSVKHDVILRSGNVLRAIELLVSLEKKNVNNLVLQYSKILT